MEESLKMIKSFFYIASSAELKLNLICVVFSININNKLWVIFIEYINKSLSKSGGR